MAKIIAGGWTRTRATRRGKRQKGAALTADAVGANVETAKYEVRRPRLGGRKARSHWEAWSSTFPNVDHAPRLTLLDGYAARPRVQTLERAATTTTIQDCKFETYCLELADCFRCRRSLKRRRRRRELSADLPTSRKY